MLVSLFMGLVFDCYLLFVICGLMCAGVCLCCLMWCSLVMVGTLELCLGNDCELGSGVN